MPSGPTRTVLFLRVVMEVPLLEGSALRERSGGLPPLLLKMI